MSAGLSTIASAINYVDLVFEATFYLGVALVAGGCLLLCFRRRRVRVAALVMLAVGLCVVVPIVLLFIYGITETGS